MELSPICLFTYKRLQETKQTIKALQENYLASKSKLFIFSDGPNNEKSIQKVEDVRSYLKTIEGFKYIEINESKTNKGLANSIIDGVSLVIDKYEKVIVLEDDLVTSPNFLNWMNQALDFYEDKSSIHSISGYTMDLSSLKKHQLDYYLGYRASSWGWGTWKDRWINVDWEIKDYNSFKWNIKKLSSFMRGGSDLPGMLRNQLKGKIDSWAIRWVFHQYITNTLTVFPSKSKLISIGFGEDATHTKKTKRYNTRLDAGNICLFKFDHDLSINKKLIRQFRRKHSIIYRLMDKLSLNVFRPFND